MRQSPAIPLTIGLMSGTSLDGIDGALVRWQDGLPQTLAFRSLTMPPALRAELMALQAPVPDELHRSRLAAVGLTRAYAEVCEPLIREAKALSAAAGRVEGHHTVALRIAYTISKYRGCSRILSHSSQLFR